MPDRMGKWERVKAALEGTEFDRPPITMWRHFYEKESTGDGLAEAMVSFARRFDWDFLKVNQRARFPAEDWGVRLAWSGDPLSAPLITKAAVHRAEDWKEVGPRDHLHGVMGEHLKALSRISRDLGTEFPIIMTVFNPLTVAGALLDKPEDLVSHLHETPHLVINALEAITETLCRFAKSCLEAGASGIFLPTTIWGSRDLMSDEYYDLFGRPYDLRLLESVSKARFNILHVCGSNNRLVDLLDYPVHALNWDHGDSTNLSLAQVRRITQKALLGGIPRHGVLLSGSPEDVRREVQEAHQEMGNRHWLLGPTCSVSPATSLENMQASLDAIRESPMSLL